MGKLSRSRRRNGASPVKAILFDMDGTLVELRQSGRMVVLNETLADFGLPPLTEVEQVERFWFTSERYAMIDSWGVQRPTFWKAFDCERVLQLQLEYTYAYEDVGQSLSKLYGLGLRLGIVSNSAHISLGHKLHLLEEHIPSHHFEVVVSCNDDVPRTKPFADGIELALARMGVEPAEAVLVGDSLDDIGAGAAAGVRVLIVNRGQLAMIYKNLANRPELSNFGVINSLRDIPQALGLPAANSPKGQAA